MNKREPIGKKLRFTVFERDKFSCSYCGRTPEEDNVILHVDHVVSVKDGGLNDLDNLVTSCFDCNSGKGAKSILRGKQTVESLQGQVESANERLEQLRSLMKLKKKLVTINKKVDKEKTSWVRAIMNTGYSEKLYHEIYACIEKNYKEASRDVVEEALKITESRHEKEELGTVPQFVKYFCGVMRNLLLTPGQQNAMRICNRYFFEHSTKMFSTTKRMILDYSDFEDSFYDEVIARTERTIGKSHGESFTTREITKKYTNQESYTVYKSGFNLNTLFCESIAMEIENLQ